MKHDPEDIDEWCRQLAGKADPASTSPRLAALRSVIQAKDRAASEATAADSVAHARMVKRLEGAGQLGRAKGSRWPQWLASAAAVLVAAVAVSFLIPDTKYRGSAGSIAIVAARPEVERAQIMKQLTALGLDPRTITEDDGVIIEVQVEPAQFEVFADWARRHGARPKVAGTYRIFVDAPSPQR